MIWMHSPCLPYSQVITEHEAARRKRGQSTFLGFRKRGQSTFSEIGTLTPVFAFLEFSTLTPVFAVRRGGDPAAASALCVGIRDRLRRAGRPGRVLPGT